MGVVALRFIVVYIYCTLNSIEYTKIFASSTSIHLGRRWGYTSILS